MSLHQRQTEFHAEIVAGDEAGPATTAGMAIYRDAYRGRLLAALEESFERTRRWVGGESFAAAACHYILTFPPRGWTLDAYGAQFAELLADLFAQDPEVSEIAWLEWHIQKAFAAVDAPQLAAATLAVAGYCEGDWAAMRFEMAAGFAARPVSTNCADLWTALGEGDAAGFAVARNADWALLVWRSGMLPRYRLAKLEEIRALQMLANGATLAALAEHSDSERLGEWLAQWFADNIFSRADPVALRPGERA